MRSENPEHAGEYIEEPRAEETPPESGMESSDGGGRGSGFARDEVRLDDELGVLKDKYLRLAAEYENFRKRTERERLESRDRAQAQLLELLLDPLDDLQRVAHFNAESTSVQALLDGVRMVERKLVRVMESAGLELLDAEGKAFDPELHEALMTVPTDEASEDETVGNVFQPGYRFRGSLLRPARVQVKKKRDG